MRKLKYLSHIPSLALVACLIPLEIKAAELRHSSCRALKVQSNQDLKINLKDYLKIRLYTGNSPGRSGIWMQNKNNRQEAITVNCTIMQHSGGTRMNYYNELLNILSQN